MERQKINLETKKLMKMKVSQQEVQQTAPALTSSATYAGTNGIQQEHKIGTVYMQQKISTKSSTSSQYGGVKKKAADFYFQKSKI